MKPEQWGSPLVQEKYQEEKACDKRHSYRIIIITTTITTTTIIYDYNTEIRLIKFTKGNMISP